MPIPALLVGVGLVGGMWALSKNKPAAPPVGTTTGAQGVPPAAVTVPSSGDPGNVVVEVDPTGQQPAQQVVSQTSPEGATDQSSSVPSQPTSSPSSPNTAPSYASAGPEGDPVPKPPPEVFTGNYQVAYHDAYGGDAGKATQSSYYANAAANGQIIF